MVRRSPAMRAAALGCVVSSAWPLPISLPSITRLVSACGRIRVLRIGGMETAHFHDLHAEGLEPDEQPVQGSLVPQRTVQDRLDRLHRRAQPLEVEQHLGREEADYADLVVGR